MTLNYDKIEFYEWVATILVYFKFESREATRKQIIFYIHIILYLNIDAITFSHFDEILSVKSHYTHSIKVINTSKEKYKRCYIDGTSERILKY
jgi:hypothetical protein